jgi:hypothetical protein
MEKFDLEDQPEIAFEIPEDQVPGQTSEEALNPELPEDTEYSPNKSDEHAFLEGIIGPEYAEDPRNTYKVSDNNEKWPEYTYETKGGKQIKVRHDAIGTMWRIEFAPGGQLPAELSGKYTNSNEANRAVEIYLARNQ